MLLTYRATLGNVRGGSLPHRDMPLSLLPPHHVETLQRTEGEECRETEVSPHVALQAIKFTKDDKIKLQNHQDQALPSIQTLKQSAWL